MHTVKVGPAFHRLSCAFAALTNRNRLLTSANLEAIKEKQNERTTARSTSLTRTSIESPVVPCENSCGFAATRGGHGSGVDSGRILRFTFGPESRVKNCEKPDPDPVSLVIFGSSRSLRGLYKCYFLSKTSNFGWIDGNRILNRSRIFKFVKFSGPDQDSKILEQERRRKM